MSCANPHCNEPARKGQLACRPCWFALPKPLREGIVSTWANRNNGIDGLKDYTLNVIEARKLWTERARSTPKGGAS